MNRILAGLLLSCAAAVSHAAGNSPATRLQCWTDEKGVRACGNSVPPQYAKGERQVIDAQGRVVQTKAREKTPDEVEAAARAAAERKERERIEAERAAYDRFLLTTYASVGDLEKARQERTGMLDSRIELAQKGVTETEATLAKLKQQVEAAKAKDRPSDKLDKQVVQFERALVDGLKAVSALKQERAAVEEKFGRDIVRYRELRSQAPKADG